MNKRVLAVVLSLLLFMAGFVRAGAVNYHEGDVEEYVMQQLSRSEERRVGKECSSGG